MRDSDEARDRADAASGIVIDSAMHIHTLLGPGALEKTYQSFLAVELRYRGLMVETEVYLPLTHRGVTVPSAYRLDMLVEGVLVVEVKGVASLLPVHHAQLVSYLRLSGRRLGLLFNFHQRHLKDGLHRVRNDW